MAKEFKIELDFVSAEGLRCVGITNDRGTRCGYVGVPQGHVLYNIEYSADLPDSVSFVTSEILHNADVSFRGVMPTFIAALTGNVNRLDVIIDVHGSLTFSDNIEDYPVENHGNLWWFGFDCAHYGDAKDETIMTQKYIDVEREMTERFGRGFADEGVIRTADYVEKQLRLLARQLWYINAMVGQSMLPEASDGNC